MKKGKTKKELSVSCGCGTKECTGGFYFLGFLGAVIYYIGAASTFGQGVLGILKAFIWPVFVVMKLLGL